MARRTDPTHIAEPLEQIHAARLAKSTVESDAPQMEAPPPDREIVEHPEREPARKSHVDSLNRPQFEPVPDGYIGRVRHQKAGLRVNQSHDGEFVGLQFARTHRAGRDKDSGEVDALESRDLRFRPHTGQWQRSTETFVRSIPDELPDSIPEDARAQAEELHRRIKSDPQTARFENYLDAVSLARQIAAEREAKQGRGR